MSQVPAILLLTIDCECTQHMMSEYIHISFMFVHYKRIIMISGLSIDDL